MQQEPVAIDHQNQSDDRTVTSKPPAGDGLGTAVGQVVTSIWTWIGICLAMSAYLVAYLQLPSSVQLWLDPRLLALIVIVVVAAVVSGLRQIFGELFRPKQPSNKEKND